MNTKIEKDAQKWHREVLVLTAYKRATFFSTVIKGRLKMKTEVYLYKSNTKFKLAKSAGYFYYHLDYFYSLGDFVCFEHDMYRCTSMVPLVMVVNMYKMVGTIYDPETEVLTPIPIEYFVDSKGREYITIMLLNKYPVIIQFNDRWFKMIHFDDETYGVESLADDFQDSDNYDVQSSVRSAIAEFNISLATTFALYPDAYLRSDNNTAIYY